jgi:hypothetical protein
MKMHYARKTHKQMPKSSREAFELDKETGTDYWHHTLVKEMMNNASALSF